MSETEENITSSYSRETGIDINETHDVCCMEDYIVLDVETTGLDLSKDRVIQLAMIKVKNDGEVQTWCKYFNPCLSRESQLNAFKIHKISPDFLLRNQTFKFHSDDIIDFIGNVKHLVGHNILFDWNYLHKEIKLAGKKFKKDGGVDVDKDGCHDLILIDTYRMSITSFPKLRSYTLQNIANHLDLKTFRQPVVKYGLSSPSKNKKEVIQVVEPAESSFHDAMTDTMVTKEVFVACAEHMMTSAEKTEMSIRDLEGKHPEFMYPVRFVLLTDKLLNGTLERSERCSLTEYAKCHMWTRGYNRGKQLKDIPKGNLVSTMQYLDSSPGKDINDQRCSALIELVLSEEAMDLLPDTVEESAGEAEPIAVHPDAPAQVDVHTDTIIEDDLEKKRKLIRPGAKISDYFAQKKLRL